MPCGEDCDDTDAFIYPGAPESCDGQDNDCDGRNDEGLGSSPVETVAIAGLQPVGIGSTERDFVYAQASRSAIFGRRVSPGPIIRQPVELIRLAQGNEFIRVEVVSQPDNRLTLVALTDLGAILWSEFGLDADGELLPGTRNISDARVTDPEELKSFWAIPHGDEAAFAYLGGPPGEPAGVRVQLSTTGEGHLVPGATTILGFASDGSQVAILPDGGDVLFLDDDGMEVSRTPALGMGTEGSLFLESPLTSGTGQVYLGTGREMDWQITELSADGSRRSWAAQPLPSTVWATPANTLYRDQRGFWVTGRTSRGTGISHYDGESTTAETMGVPTSPLNRDLEARVQFESTPWGTGILHVDSSDSAMLTVDSSCN